VRSVRLILGSLALLACLPGLVGCVGHPPGASLRGDLRLLAPTSLTNVLPVLVYQFTTAHGGVKVHVTYGPDVRGTAPSGDVLLVEGASALAGVEAGQPTVFAHDQFVLAVPLTDPLALGSVPDLARPGLRVARCAPAQPCGQGADALLAAAGVHLTAPILVDDVRSALDLVVHNQADVAMVYRTDAQQAQDTITAVEFPESSQEVAQFQAVTLARSTNPDAAKAFVDFLVTGPAQDILSGHFFQLP
jgi:molybdate transport system substrate-binding protein